MNKLRQDGESDRELISLAEATVVAYDVIALQPALSGKPREFSEMRGLIALALSALAPIYARRDGNLEAALSAAEIEEQLFFPTSHSHRDRTKAASLVDVYIRRGDLIRAMESLKTARASFELPES